MKTRTHGARFSCQADTGSGASAQAAAPIHAQHLAGDEAGVVGQQEGDGGRHSAGAPRRFIGTEANARFSASLPAGRVARNISVSIGPGATALTVMPYSASSSAQVRVQPTSALLAAE